ncbi:MAG: alpha/beta hydrolase-fold protein [Deinococcales bacterium]
MQRHYHKIYSPALGKDMEMLVFGHYGKPMIAFPSGGGRYFDFESNGMVESVAHLMEEGKLKLYCIDGIDHESWLKNDIDPHWRAVRHNAYQDYVVKDIVPFIYQDCQGNRPIGLAGCSLGAYHVANFALKFPELFPYGIAMSGRYDLEALGIRSDSQEVYFNNPVAYVANLQGDTLEHLKRSAYLILVCGQGAYEDKCLAETHRLADLLSIKGIRHERDIWGHDVEHHWYWWAKQFPHHLSKIV